MMNWPLALPEIFLALAGMLLLLLAAFRGEKGGGFVASLTVFSFAVAGYLLWAKGNGGGAFGGAFIADDFGRYLKTLVLLGSATSIALGKGEKAEYPVLILFAALGMMLMISAHDLIALYVGLELQNLALYVLAAFHRDDKRASEAGVKYFTLGALSSAILLFGLSLLYGYAGATNYAEIAAKIVENGSTAPGLAVAVAFTLAGLAFKIAAVPFHMWSPDVYEGAPMPVAAFLAAVPKIAALGLMTRLLVEPLGGAVEVWRPLVVSLAVASMLLGGFAGLVQGNMKRLMAYSGIINMGSMLVGLAVFAPGIAEGVEGLLLYLALYVPGVLCVFGVLIALRTEKIHNLSGLSKTKSSLALALGAALFSLAGIPPLAGFFGKYMVFLAAVKGEALALAILGVSASVVAAGYYLRIVKVMYFDPPHGDVGEEAQDRATRFVVALSAAIVTFFVLIPAPLMEAAQKVSLSLVSQ